MKDWWDKLQAREQGLLLIGGLAVMIFLCYSLVWSPLVKAIDHKRMRVENNQQLLAWMVSKSAQIKQLKLTNPNIINADNQRSLLAIIDSVANRLGLRNSIKQIQPEGADLATIWIEEISFDALAKMLGQLDKNSNVRVTEANITRVDKPGMVKARIALKRA